MKGMWVALMIFLMGGINCELTKIDEDNWQDLLTGEWMVEVFAPWCPACRGLQPTWEEFAGWSEDLEIGVGQVDVTVSPGLSGRFMVTSLPTIFHVKDGVFRQYNGARHKDSFISFIEDKKWGQVEPVSSWSRPDSIQMTLVSYFFKLSMVLRNVHTSLTEDYQLPYWVSYVAFGVITILLGGVLGLLLVCCIDCIYPPSRSREEEEHVDMIRRGDKKDSDVDEEDDDLEEEGNLSQEEGDLSQEEDDGTQDEEGSQGEDEGEASQGEGDNTRDKTRRRRPRKAD